jgi:hypothetical protein
MLRLGLLLLHGKMSAEYIILGGHIICRCVQVHLLSGKKRPERPRSEILRWGLIGYRLN